MLLCGYVFRLYVFIDVMWMFYSCDVLCCYSVYVVMFSVFIVCMASCSYVVVFVCVYVGMFVCCYVCLCLFFYVFRLVRFYMFMLLLSCLLHCYVFACLCVYGVYVLVLCVYRSCLYVVRFVCL